MNAIPPLAHLTPPDLQQDERPETPQERTGRQLRMCRRLAELGMQLAQAAAEQSMALNYVRLCTSVRQSVELEASIAAGPKKSRALRPYDPRRAPLRRIFTEGTERHHDRDEARRALIQAGEQALAEDPQGERKIFDIVWQVCRDIGIKINKRTLHDEMLVLVEHWEGDVDNHPLLKPFPAWLIPLLPNGPSPCRRDL